MFCTSILIPAGTNVSDVQFPERKVIFMLHQRPFKAPRQGSVTVTSALLMIFLLGMVAFVVDIGNLCLVTTQAQAVADAAALAGARGLAISPAQVRSNAKTCANQNSANGNAITLQDANVVLGTWNTSTSTFTVLTGSAESSATAVQVTVPLTAANSNPVTLFFARVFGLTSSDVTCSATAACNRWDLVIVTDKSSSYAASLPYMAGPASAKPLSGFQNVLTNMNTFTNTSNLGVVTFTGWGFTDANLQPVGTNYSTLQTAIGNIKDCSSAPSSSTYTTAPPGIPQCSGSDLSAGIQQAVNLFTAASYNPPSGTRKAILFTSDGASNASTHGSHPTYSGAQLDTAAQTIAKTAWTNYNISVFSLLYTGTGAGSYDASIMQSMAQGLGTYIQVSNAANLPSQLNNVLMTNLSMQLVK